MLLIYHCTNPECDLRFSLSDKEKKPINCPRCKNPFSITQVPHDTIQAKEISIKKKHRTIEVLLDNIRSTLNVGSIFRTADGAGISKLHICGITPTPDHPKMIKTGLGAEWSVPWDYHPNGLKLAQIEKQKGTILICLEIGPNSKSLFDAPLLKITNPLLLVVGNEVTGVDPDIASLCDETLHIPMSGYKKSLNVSVAFGIVAYQLMFALS